MCSLLQKIFRLIALTGTTAMRHKYERPENFCKSLYQSHSDGNLVNTLKKSHSLSTPYESVSQYQVIAIWSF